VSGKPISLFNPALDVTIDRLNYAGTGPGILLLDDEQMLALKKKHEQDPGFKSAYFNGKIMPSGPVWTAQQLTVSHQELKVVADAGSVYTAAEYALADTKLAKKLAEDRANEDPIKGPSLTTAIIDESPKEFPLATPLAIMQQKYGQAWHPTASVWPPTAPSAAWDFATISGVRKWVKDLAKSIGLFVLSVASLGFPKNKKTLLITFANPNLHVDLTSIQNCIHDVLSHASPWVGEVVCVWDDTYAKSLLPPPWGKSSTPSSGQLHEWLDDAGAGLAFEVVSVETKFDQDFKLACHVTTTKAATWGAEAQLEQFMMAVSMLLPDLTFTWDDCVTHNVQQVPKEPIPSDNVVTGARQSLNDKALAWSKQVAATPAKPIPYSPVPWGPTGGFVGPSQSSNITIEDHHHTITDKALAQFEQDLKTALTNLIPPGPKMEEIQAHPPVVHAAGPSTFLIHLRYGPSFSGTHVKGLGLLAKDIDEWMLGQNVQTHTIVLPTNVGLDVATLQPEGPAFQTAFEAALHNYLSANQLSLVTHEQMMQLDKYDWGTE